MDAKTAAITRWRPQLAGTPFAVNREGWDCVVLDGGGFIFKFPRDRAAMDRLIREAHTLTFAAPFSVVPIPKMTLIEDSAMEKVDGLAVFSVHEKILGAPLDPSRYNGLDRAARDVVARDIAATMVSFHRADPEAARAQNVPEAPIWPSSEVLLREAMPYLDEDRAAVARTVLRVREMGRDDAIVFGHFDTHGWNIALDPCGRLAGLFDFGHAGVGPLHRDLSYPAFIAADCARRVVDHYRALTGRPVDTARCLYAHAVLRLVELHDAAPAFKSTRAAAFARTMDDIASTIRAGRASASDPRP